jgi:hypothetical protein
VIVRYRFGKGKICPDRVGLVPGAARNAPGRARAGKGPPRKGSPGLADLSVLPAHWMCAGSGSGEDCLPGLHVINSVERNGNMTQVKINDYCSHLNYRFIAYAA